LIDYADYIKFIRSNGCRVCGQLPVDADHLEARGMGGGKKSGTVSNTKRDLSCIPLCRLHHTERHQLGNARFQILYRINVWQDAFRLLRQYFAE